MSVNRNSALLVTISIIVGSTIPASSSAFADSRFPAASKQERQNSTGQPVRRVAPTSVDTGIHPIFGSRCRWLKRKARWTGSRYWWRKYRQCVRYHF